MILLFPDIDTFRLVLTGGFVPSDVLLAAATVAFGADGRISVESAAKLTKKATADLTRLGVLGTKRHLGPAAEVSCWPQILPVTRDAAPPQLSSQAPVLFELDSKDLPVLVGEMLRLGNDRQGVRWLTSDGDAADRRALLRVVGPPYYTLLRAIDPAAGGTATSVHAYVEHAPRVWVQIGYSHPFADQIKLADGQVLLVRPPRAWTYLPDGPFRDVYEVLNLKLPAAPIDWTEAPVRDKLAVPLRLVAGNAADAAELWVLRGDAVGQLDALARDADDRIVQRLKFAVAAGAGGETVVVLRVTASKLAAPVIPLTGAVGFRPYYKLQNLYIPAGSRLHPTLRRDAVRKLLADDADRLVWLYPKPDGTFAPESIPEDAFRPLEDWVDYVIETNHAPLAEWVDATRFDFEHYVCTDALSPKPPKGPDEEKGKGKRRGGKGDADDVPLTPATPGTKAPDASAASAPTSKVVAPTAQAKVPPSEWQVRRQALEDEFLAVEGPLDDPARLALWPQLAAANTGFGDLPEAALCWVNAMWEVDAPPREWVDGWVRSEFPNVDLPLPPALFEQHLKQADPSPVEMRRFAALLVWVAGQSPPPVWLRARLSAVQVHLEANEGKLPLRVVWLAAARVAALAGADTLGLARVRDRLLRRLLDDGGPKPERDLPTFLRYAGSKDTTRIRLVRDKVLGLHAQVRTWVDKSLRESTGTGGSVDRGATLAYVDLFFAFGLAKLGESELAKGLLTTAGQTLKGFTPETDLGVAAEYLYAALAYRIEEALAGRSHSGLLSPALVDELEQIRAKGQGQLNNPNALAYYSINRMREQFHILEPQEQLDPYGDWTGQGDEIKKALVALPRIKDPAVLARTIRELYRSAGDKAKAAPDARFVVLWDTLLLAARVGEAFTVELLGLVPEAMAASGTATGSDLTTKQGQLLERALFLAAHYDRRDLVRQLASQFADLVRAKPVEQRYEIVNVVAAQSLRSLRKLGLRDEVDKLFHALRDAILGGQTAAQLRDRYKHKTDTTTGLTGKNSWAKALQSLLNLAGAWLTFGAVEQAGPILDDARVELLGPAGDGVLPKIASPTESMALAKEYTATAQAYIAALGHGPAEDGLGRIAELFRYMDPKRVTNTYTTSKFYSRYHLNLVEETILAVVSDDFALGPAGRRWLDEDEFLVRRRVHRDMKARLKQSGL
ncbi:hypothetical protein [Fimbriiglobus ruber]|uniref:FtsH ternary system domain-containing protein n=1 Tax=Fimbriiglobus ruber TaxID=1908690 RepID=A0A225DKA5_9BACT|nr:hypothetical protein [Fimbriiglobus ruber]OWK41881.1 hypothetical protein FRUB_03959 [Fimbriiglobus ruber]